MLKVTPAAAAAILDSANRSGADGMALRLAAKVGADGAAQFGLGFDEEREQDRVIESHGARVLVAPPSQPLLSGVTLDFGEMENGELGFVFLRGGASGGEA
ncbi:MAG TPA: iron-sulfur cluster biosynthesis family protein [Burkholderiales bacterium]|nr:iron-sulfur cluster biosynthesis family protein [Burkholderiales bacterium]